MLFKKVTSLKSSFREKITLYGKKATVMITVKAILRKLIGVDWREYYLMSRRLEDVGLLREREDIKVCELTISDYDNELWKNFLSENERIIYEAQFKNKRAKAYGAFIDSKLAYSTWILYGEIIYSERKILLKQDDCALLLDTYCHPQFRGKGIHNYMNHWCLCEMKRHGSKKAYVIVLSYNRPAIKTQLKCGMQIERTFYRFLLWKKTYCTLNINKIENC